MSVVPCTVVSVSQCTTVYNATSMCTNRKCGFRIPLSKNTGTYHEFCMRSTECSALPLLQLSKSVQ